MIFGLRWIIVLLFLVACAPDKDTLFTKLSPSKTGIDFINDNHETERSNILTYEYFYNGGGVALGDINNDGLTDIYFTSNLFSNKLYLNLGNFKFKDITEQSGTACEAGWKTGVTMADINGDGFLDIYVCRSASPDPERRRNILLINNGDMTFTDRAADYNLDDDSYSTHAAFFDFDNDGDLDAFILNHSLLEISNVFNITVKNSDTRFPHVGNRLYRNDGGVFVDVSDSVGVYGSAFNYGLGISLSDVDDDGWIDIYTGSDYTARDKLLINDHGKFFRDVTGEQLSHISKFTMGTDIADVNGDGLMDIFTLDMLPEDNHRQKQLMGSDRYDVYNTMVKSGLHSQYMRNMLHLNNGDGTFSEIGQLTGTANTDWSWGVLIQDYDNDGLQDIFVSNGFKRDLTNNDFAKYKAAQEIEAARKRGENINILSVLGRFSENKLPNYIFKGNGDLTFTNVASTWGFNEPLISNGIAYADLDNDGDLDLVVNNMNDRAGIYRNNAEALNNNFLSVRVKGRKNTFGIGAKVMVYANGKKFVKEQFPVRGFQSSVDHVLHFGLGTANRVDSICVRWPEGGWSTVKSVTTNQTLVVHEENLATRNRENVKTPVFSRVNVIDFKHKENEFNDFNIQPLLPRKYSTLGPALTSGDVNNDGMDDVFVGGAKGQIPRLFIQDKKGQYKWRSQEAFEVMRESEIIDAVFFDMDSDNDLDLYVVTGGYEFSRADKALEDWLFENDGKGNFTRRKLPSILQSGSCVRPVDIDRDGDVDLFVGGRIIPGRYPETPESYILINDGKGNFTVSDQYSEVIRNIGMVTDAAWIDLNGDNLPDLVVTGEWMPVSVFINSEEGLKDATSSFFPYRTEGFWNCILAEDFDQDGDVDLVIGNLGLNNQMRVTPSQPVRMYYADYDANGSVDPLLDYLVMDKSYPYPSRDELLEQLPAFKKRFTDYKSYADATIADVLTPQELISSKTLEVYTLQTSYFRNNGDHFEMITMPLPFQMAPIYALVSADVNGDGVPDVISGGNLSATRARTGKLTGNYGIVGYGDGKGNFTAVMPAETGLSLTGDVRQLIYKEGKLIAAVNNGGVQVFEKRD